MGGVQWAFGAAALIAIAVVVLTLTLPTRPSSDTPAGVVEEPATT